MLSRGWLAVQEGRLWGTKRKHGWRVPSRRHCEPETASAGASLLLRSQSACSVADSHVQSGVEHPNADVTMSSNRTSLHCR